MDSEDIVVGSFVAYVTHSRDPNPCAHTCEVAMRSTDTACAANGAKARVRKPLCPCRLGGAGHGVTAVALHTTMHALSMPLLHNVTRPHIEGGHCDECYVLARDDSEHFGRLGAEYVGVTRCSDDSPTSCIRQ